MYSKIDYLFVSAFCGRGSCCLFCFSVLDFSVVVCCFVHLVIFDVQLLNLYLRNGVFRSCGYLLQDFFTYQCDKTVQEDSVGVSCVSFIFVSFRTNVVSFRRNLSGVSGLGTEVLGFTNVVVVDQFCDNKCQRQKNMIRTYVLKEKRHREVEERIHDNLFVDFQFFLS